MNTEEDNGFIEQSTLSPVKSIRLGIGYNDKEFVFVVDYKDDKEQEQNFSTTFSPDTLKDLITLLFEAGKNFQKQHKVDIGFENMEE